VSVEPLKLELQIRVGGKGLLWSLWSIHNAKASGLLTVEWERFTKQIMFRAGEPVASRSNWPQESLAQFLLKKLTAEQGQLRQELMSWQLDPQKLQLGEWLVAKNVISASQMSDLLSEHFRERVFGLIGLSHGRLKFDPSAQLTDTDVESSQLQGSFLKLLWDASKSYFDAGVCRSRLSQRLNQRLRATGAFPLPLLPQELRVWNSLSKEFKAIDPADELVLKLVTVAAEFDQLEFGQDNLDDLLVSLKSLEERTISQKYHEIFGVDLENLNQDLVKKSYLEMVKKYHPDRLPSSVATEVRSLAERVFARVNEAFSTLTHPEKLSEYQAQLKIEKAGGREKIESQIQAEQLISKAKLALRGKRYRQAQELFSEIVRSLPEDQEVLADFVYAEMMASIEEKRSVKERLPQLIRQFETCAKARPNYGCVFYYLGLSYKMEGRLDKALMAFDRAADLDKSLPEAFSEARILRMKLDAAKSGKKG